MEMQEAIKAWEELEIKDDFMFAKVMQDKKLCKKLLERLLQTKIRDIVYLEEQKSINIEKDAKIIRLDVYIEDGNRVFDLEMQTTDKRNLPKRSRYYQGMIDLNTIEKGENYKKLKESYVIFICTFDPFHQGKAQYTFENFCIEDKELKLNDGAKKIFFNAKDYINAEDEEIREFLKYVNGEKSDSPFVKEIEDRVAQIKASEEWRLEYMTLLMREQEIWEEAEEKGRKMGREEGREEGIRGTVNLLKELNIPLQTILVKIQQQYNLSPETSEKYI
ncbi:Rpn family recombination-promoting nuclease/putative transposase [Sporofaciens musculi]|uniref:Rpn family recombination-promoting nuclease/putative transposase n=1 Tax=Sporofaciens musculi TaxID=2681861 RepID=UPI00259CFF50|nr:Rpn family recombination-promoting nuclease/putative transposase [Sporofaciens musculi]